MLDDLDGQSEVQLQERVTATFAQLALLSMQHLRSADPAAAEGVLRGWASLTARLASAASGQDDLLTQFSYILQIGCLPEERVATVLTEITPATARNTMLTTAEQMRRRLIKENGPRLMARGQARVLLSQLAQKFGPLEKAVAARIRRARSEPLDRWAERILTATGLDEVFAK